MNWLNRQVDIASLLFFRIAFGIMAVCEMIAQLTYKHWYKGYYDPEEFHFHYIGFEFVNPFPEPFMSIFLIALVLIAFAILLGYRYRLSTTLFAIGYTYLYLIEKGLYLNHGYLFCWLSFVMIFLPAHKGLSLDVFHKRVLRRESIPYWPVFLLCFLMGVVYFFGGIAKINPDWLRGIPLNSWVGGKSDMPVLGWLWGLEYTPLVMSYAGLLTDLLAPFLLSWKKSRKWMLFAIIIFHLTNMILFNIGIFPWLSLCLSSLYFDPDWPRKWWHYVKERFSRAEQVDEWFAKKLPLDAAPQVTEDKLGLLGYTLVLLLMLTHLLLPLRLHLFPGPVAWTEEGHRYSWRMMLRAKSGYGYFYVRETGTDREVKENAKNWMSKKMNRKLYTHPDMIWQFAQHLEAHYKANGWEKPEVYADIRAKLNDGKYQAYIDKNVDLAAESWNFFKSKSWIIPLKSEQVKTN